MAWDLGLGFAAWACHWPKNGGVKAQFVWLAP